MEMLRLKLPKYWRAGLLGLVASLLAIYFIFSQMGDVGQMVAAFRGANYGWVIVSIGISVLGLIFRGARWRALLGGVLPFMRAFNILNVAYLVNGVIPFRVGELVRAYLAARAQPPVPPMKTISTVIVERLTDVLAVVVIMGLALSLAPLPDELRSAAQVIAPAAALGFIVLVIVARRRGFALTLAERILSRVGIKGSANLLRWLEHFLDGLTPLARMSTLVEVSVLTAISWVFSLLAGYVLMIAFYGHGDWAATLLFTAAASLAVAVPAVPGNLGTYELSILLALGATGYGEPAAAATAFAIAVHAVNLLVNSVLGIYGFIREGVSLDQLSQGVREMQAETGEAQG